ncbi:macrophage mannose receptor 1-like isoform X1 [Maniola jurtina]|uniref:macrophage mannose receptor 1-like isoform X1 n=1 Tax=Maniola jurtina TaxID=191418 RepID=UPI001E68DE68|nr:macrophage mannose receptor 1-like isoform X1 [Maniola jurtina]
MRRTLSCLLVFTLVTILNGRHFRCDYTYFNKADGWLKLHRIPANWREARLRCHLEGSKLASPLNSQLAAAMRSVTQQNALTCGIYTGIHSSFSRGDFHSVEGIPLSRIPHTWAEGEPDNLNNEESCMMMLDSGELADVNCSETLPYLCYRKTTRTALGDCGTVDSEYKLESRTGSCYKFHKVPRTWSRAYMACAAEGGHLAIINSDTEAQVIKEIFAKHPGGSMRGNFWKEVAFVGFHDWGEHGEYLTIEGQTLEEAGYAKFSGGEPNNATTGEYCGAVYRSGLLDDLWCENAYAFICEKSPDSLLCDDNDQQ